MPRNSNSTTLSYRRCQNQTSHSLLLSTLRPGLDRQWLGNENQVAPLSANMLRIAISMFSLSKADVISLREELCFFPAGESLSL